MVVGILQTPDYARCVFNGFAALHQSPRDIDAAMRARMRRQDLLHRAECTFHIVMWEAASRLRSLHRERWKAPLNAFQVAFEGRLTPTDH
ncbi:Scr1 family TA system antitoxin-like transcriptional regulator [Streptomyces sp. NPDC056061]|uniref:Scr1 family TA system antitoxin-like transcriptional regulator n=1 Tax=Streptomyces sp. NPDC056061 TaxID=3345700 RepID=UPI0035DCBD0A